MTRDIRPCVAVIVERDRDAARTIPAVHSKRTLIRFIYGMYLTRGPDFIVAGPSHPTSGSFIDLVYLLLSYRCYWKVDTASVFYGRQYFSHSLPRFITSVFLINLGRSLPAYPVFVRHAQEFNRNNCTETRTVQ